MSLAYHKVMIKSEVIYIPLGNSGSTEQISLELPLPLLITTNFVQAMKLEPYGTSGVNAFFFKQKQ